MSLAEGQQRLCPEAVSRSPCHAFRGIWLSGGGRNEWKWCRSCTLFCVPSGVAPDVSSAHVLDERPDSRSQGEDIPSSLPFQPVAVRAAASRSDLCHLPMPTRICRINVRVSVWGGRWCTWCHVENRMQESSSLCRERRAACHLGLSELRVSAQNILISMRSALEPYSGV